ncbi:MAG: hypothetical protein AAGA27_08060 [Pseudomonadota bacterium]
MKRHIQIYHLVILAILCLLINTVHAKINCLASKDKAVILYFTHNEICRQLNDMLLINPNKETAQKLYKLTSDNIGKKAIIVYNDDMKGFEMTIANRVTLSENKKCVKFSEATIQTAFNKNISLPDYSEKFKHKFKPCSEKSQDIKNR